MEKYVPSREGHEEQVKKEKIWRIQADLMEEGIEETEAFEKAKKQVRGE